MPVTMVGATVSGAPSRPVPTASIAGLHRKPSTAARPQRLGVCKAASPEAIPRPAEFPFSLKDMYIAAFRAMQRTAKGYGWNYLEGAWAPVKKEIHSSALKVVEGQIPVEMDGWYLRTGPNPQHTPQGGYNWFADGDAMIHATLFKDGEAKSYTNHWVRNFKFTSEREIGENIYLRLGEQKGWIGLILTVMQRAAWKIGFFPTPKPLQGHAQGMAGIVITDNKVLGLHEGNIPIELKLNPDGSVETVASHDFNGQLTHALTAHPKLDWFTGEMISFGNSLEKAPHVIFNIIKPDGTLTKDKPIDVRGPLWMHDFGITTNYAVFPEHNVILDLMAMVRDHKVPFVTDNTIPGRIGLLSRKNIDEPVRWFDVDPFVNLHVANAWESTNSKGEELVNIVICRVKEMDLSMASEAKPKCGDPAILTRYTMNTTTGEAVTTSLWTEYGIELPVVAPQVVGRPNSRYCWCVIQQGMKFSGIVKCDMRAGENEAVIARIDLPDKCFHGEVNFVPRNADALARGEIEDDDGWVVGYMTDETTLTSYCVIYDAKTMSPEPVAKIQLPQRVPYGFHGTYFERFQIPGQTR